MIGHLLTILFLAVSASGAMRGLKVEAVQHIDNPLPITDYILWLDPRRGTYTNISATVPVGQRVDYVRLWVDRGPNGYVFTNTFDHVSSRFPMVYVPFYQGSNGIPLLSSEGLGVSGSFTSTTSIDFTGGTGVTAIVVARHGHSQVNSYPTLLSLHNAQFLLRGFAQSMRMEAYNGTQIIDATASRTNNLIVIAARFNDLANTLSVWTNGVVAASSASAQAMPSNNRLGIGYRTDTAIDNYWMGSFGDIFLWKRPLTDAEMFTFCRHLMTNYNAVPR
jgi:hypothetical protein